jgi:hypothetical protein
MKPLFAVSVLALTGCVTFAEMDQRRVSHMPVQYQNGYVDGCASGRVAGGYPYDRMRKDVNRYASDNIYKQGWDDAFSGCKARYLSP